MLCEWYKLRNPNPPIIYLSTSMNSFSPRRFVSGVSRMLRGGNAVQEWREHLLNASTANFLLNEDPVVEFLQTSIAKLDESTSFAAAFARLTTYFAVPYQDKDLFRYLRASVQILVIYSITSGDHQWISAPAARELGRLGSDLGSFVFKPQITKAPVEEGAFSINNCMHLASLLETSATLNILRAKIIRNLSTLATLLPPTAPFRPYDPSNTYHTWNAANLLAKLYPDSNYMVGMAFALVMNPLVSGALYKDVPPAYSPKSDGDRPLIEV
ncbi:MAG: hypothetical protein Q9178_005122 [Gyalolechia marmorata]